MQNRTSTSMKLINEKRHLNPINGKTAMLYSIITIKETIEIRYYKSMQSVNVADIE